METFTAAVLLVSMLLTGCATTKFVDSRDAQKGKSAAMPLVAALADYQRNCDKFPQSIEDLNLPAEVGRRIREAGLRFQTQNEQSEYILSFAFPAFPLLTVTCVQGSKGGPKNWQCLGK